MRRLILTCALALAACNSSKDVTLVVSPASATVTVGKKLQLGAIDKSGISWSVREAGGGAVDATGLYTAPATPGTFHVVATSADDSKKWASAAITVVPAPAKPAITTSAPRITAGRIGTAGVAPQPGMTFTWTIFNGTFTGADTGASVTFTSEEAGEVVVGCSAANAAGDSSPEGLAVVGVLPPLSPPAIDAPLALTKGRSGMRASVEAEPGITYTWTVGNGTATAGAGSDSLTFTAGTTSPLTLTVVGKNAADDTSPPSTFTVQLYDPGLELAAGGPGGKGNLDGQGAAARFDAPQGIAADSAGNLYVTDHGVHTLRKIAADGTVSTIAGTYTRPGTADGPRGTGLLFGPNAVAVDEAGTLYVSEDSLRVRRVLPNGDLSTIAGNNVLGTIDGDGQEASFANPQAIAVSPDGGLIWVGQADGYLRQITPNADGGPMQVSSPYLSSYVGGVALNPLDDVFFTQTVNPTISGVEADFVVDLAGTSGTPGSTDGVGAGALFDGPRGIAWDKASGAIYLADRNNSTIRKLSFSFGAWTSTTPAGQPGDFSDVDGPLATARLNSPWGVAVLPGGGVAFSEEPSPAIRKMEAGAVSTIAGRIHQAGHVDGPALSARFETFPSNDGPLGLAVDGRNNAFVTDGNYIRRLAADGTVSTWAGTGASAHLDGLAGSAAFSGPRGLALDRKSGILYVADTGSGNLRSVTFDRDLAAEVVGTVAGPGDNQCLFQDGDGLDAGFCRPTGLAADSKGRVFVADTGNAAIRLLERTPDGGGYTVKTLASGSPCLETGARPGSIYGGLCDPAGIAVDSRDRLYIADRGNSMIKELQQDGGSWTMNDIAGVGRCATNDGEGFDAGFCEPVGVAVDARGDLWVSEQTSGAIRRLSFNSATGAWTVTTPAGVLGRHGFAAGTPGGANRPAAVAATPYGDVLVLDAEENSLLLVRPP
jgi:sugar lactone lactonase YvrE